MDVRNRADLTAQRIRESLARHVPDARLSQSAARRAAVAIVLSRDESAASALHLLMIQRAAHPLDPWSGHMAFPGGRQEAPDASLEATARRETLEEVALRLDEHALLGRLDDIHTAPKGAQAMSISPFVYYTPAPGTLIANAEVARIVWVPLAHLLDSANIRPYTPAPPAASGECPSLPYDGCTIWGLTYRMLCLFAKTIGTPLDK